MEKAQSLVFGPVPSRRLGRSLGVDLVPFKTCSYDCVYCQLGRTTHKTTERREWYPLEEVVRQVAEKLDSKPDYVTLSGSGEPTLHARVGELIARIKEMTDVPVAVLTNGSLLWDPAVRQALAGADLVVPSLDAGDERLFRYVNRPVSTITFEQMVDGLVAFRDSYRGRYWLEVFLLDGVTALDAEIEKMAAIIERIRPDKVQLNTVTRPPAEQYAYAVSRERMERAAAMLGERAEVIADFRQAHQMPSFVARRQDVLDMLLRRPCTVEDVAAGLGMHRNEAVKYLEELSAEGKLVAEMRGAGTYYRALADQAAGGGPRAEREPGE